MEIPESGLGSSGWAAVESTGVLVLTEKHQEIQEC